MARRRRSKVSGSEVVDYRHKNASRLNIPPAGLAARGRIVREKRIQYAYNPHLAPALRFDGTGGADQIFDLIDAAKKRPLAADEVKMLEEAFRNHEPWLEWAGKQEQPYCVADPVALHLHERISTQAILRTARRQEVQRDLFADPEQEYREAVQFYQHSMDWTNRMILGDSLAVMASLARREDLAGKVQMIYMDPPYGIKYSSNFQPEVGRRDVKDRDQDLTREPEMVKAYRDTWTLGVHSYLSYLRDRLLLCRELLADTGSVFVQIGDENKHRVRVLLDDIFGCDKFVAEIAFLTTTGRGSARLDRVFDTLLWYTKSDPRVMRYHQVLKRDQEDDDKKYPYVDADGSRFMSRDSSSQGETDTGRSPFHYAGKAFTPPVGRHWSTTDEGMTRLAKANRLYDYGNQLRVKRFDEDLAGAPIGNLWVDTQRGSFVQNKVYVVQTAEQVIERCLLMATDPGDLVLDPTCVRKGTRVLTPPRSPRERGEGVREGRLAGVYP